MNYFDTFFPFLLILNKLSVTLKMYEKDMYEDHLGHCDS